MITPARVFPAAADARASPKSTTLTRPSSVGALVVDAHDVRVGQLRDGLGLADEPPHEVGVARQVSVHDLKRHLPVKPGVGGEVHGGHAAVRDARADVVPPVEHPPDEHVRGGRFHQGDFTARAGRFRRC
jgi:hypothetical protein